MVLLSLVLLLAILMGGLVAAKLASLVATLSTVLVVLWLVFVAFCLYFFRDPDPQPPPNRDAILAPGHGKVDVVDEITEPDFMGGPCKRVSIFLSVFDVHVQNAPIAGRVTVVRHRAGQFLNAMRLDSAALNENVLIGIESPHPQAPKIGLRLIAGLIARRIIPWVEQGDRVEPGQRISLIQFGSRVDLYLPLSARIQVKVGDRVRGGETIMAVCG